MEPEQQSCEDCVDAHALPRTRRARDQEMGHFGQIVGIHLTGYRFSEGDRKRGLRFSETVRIENAAQVDDGRVLVRNLNPDRALPRYRGDDANPPRRQRQREVVCEVDDSADLHAGGGNKFIKRDDRPRCHAHRFDLNAAQAVSARVPAQTSRP